MPQRLFSAAKSGTPSEITALLKSGIDVHAQDENGRTALHIAAENNNVAVARCLLEHGAQIDAPMNDNGTPLFDAVACGHVEMVTFLLRTGANYALLDDNGWSILHWAVEQEKPSVVELLIIKYPEMVDYEAPDFGRPYNVASERMYRFLSRINAVPLLTVEEFHRRIHSIAPNIPTDGNYSDLAELKLSQQKGKAYIYLRQCILAYRNGHHEELMQVLFFLNSAPKNKKWLADKLLDTSKTELGEQWGSGAHEWLERSLIIDVLRRSAGMIDRVEATGTIDGKTVDWLSVQAIVRSPTKYLFYKQPTNAIRFGHSGAVKPDLNERGFSSAEGEGRFHEQLEAAFKNSTTITGFMKRVHNIFKRETISGKKTLAADAYPQFVVDGTATNDARTINIFRREKLKIHGYDVTNHLIKHWLFKTATKPLADYSASPLVESDSDEITLTLPKH